MRLNKIIPFLIILAIFGLGFIQYKFLISGLKLEQRKFNQEIFILLDKLMDELSTDERQVNNLAIVNNQGWLNGSSNIEAVEIELLDYFNTLIDSLLTNKKLSIEYSFAIGQDLRKSFHLTTPNFKIESFNYEKFQVVMPKQVGQACRCQLHFILHVNHLFQYLLKQLYSLVIPAGACLVLLLFGFVWIIIQFFRLRKLHQIKNDFINNLTHELKTPAFSISILLKMLRVTFQSNPQPNAEKYLDLLEKENSKIKLHTEKVLELASLETNTLNSTFASINVHQLLQEVILDYKPKVNELNGQLKINLQAVDPKINGDSNLIKTAFHNILDNAIKYSSIAPVIEVETQSVKGSCKIFFSDNGVGIPINEQKRVFNKFYRINTGNIHQAKGFGLGLNYVKQIVTLHRGKINLDSEVGKGSTFCLSFPIRKT